MYDTTENFNESECLELFGKYSSSHLMRTCGRIKLTHRDPMQRFTEWEIFA